MYLIRKTKPYLHKKNHPMKCIQNLSVYIIEQFENTFVNFCYDRFFKFKWQI